MISQNADRSLQTLSITDRLRENCDNGLNSVQKRVATFPWLLFSLTWITTFALENSMDAPATWLQGITVSDITEASNEGTLIRKVLVTSLGLVGAFCLYFWGRHRFRFNSTRARLLIAYVAWIGLSGVWADDPTLTIRRQIAFGMTLLFAAACVARMNVNVLSVFIAAVPALNLIPGLIAELRYGDFHPFSGDSRFTGTAVHPNVQAAGLSLATMITCWLVWRTRGRLRLGVACASLIMIAFLLMTGSRTSALAFALAGAFSILIVIVRDYRDKLPFLTAVLAVVIGIGGLAALAINSFSKLPNGLDIISGDRTGDLATANGRVDLWRECIHFAAEHPVFGYGFGSFWSEKRIEMISEDQEWPIQQSHSAYLDQVLALGVPGAGLYTLLLLGSFGTCVIQFFRRRDGYGVWAAVLLIIIIVNATESINISPVYPNFAFILIVLHVALVNPKSEQPNTLSGSY